VHGLNVDNIIIKRLRLYLRSRLSLSRIFMTDPDSKEKHRSKRYRNLVAKANRHKPKQHKPKVVYSRAEGKRIDTQTPD